MDDPTASLVVTDGPPQRGRLLALIADYILEHGVSELTLRALRHAVPVLEQEPERDSSEHSE